MTASRSYGLGDLVGVRISGGSGDFPDLATQQIVALGALDPHRVVRLLRVADVAAFFTREEPHSGAIEPHVRTWHCGYAMMAERACSPFLSRFPDLATGVLIRLIRNCLSARRAMAIDEVSESLRNAVAAYRAPPESVPFDHEIEPDADRQNDPAGDGIVCGVSRWFSPHGVRYHEDLRSVSRITRADWSALLEHADAIDYRGATICWPAVTPARGPAGCQERRRVIKSTNGVITIRKGERRTHRAMGSGRVQGISPS